MSGSKKMTLRVQSAEGTTRVEASGSEPTAALYERVHDALRLRSFAFALHRDRARREELASSKSRRLQDAGLQHGDMLYLSPINGAVLFDTPDTQKEDNEESHMEAGPSTSMDTATAPVASSKPVEDEVDLQLYQMSGLIHRQRDEKLCRHNSQGCCVHCSPLEPWDEGYLREHNIKHMSFHSYLRKITTGKFISLSEPNLTIKPGCTEHPPWPRGICSKCQPGAVTLARQPWRLVDNVLLEAPAIVERFLGYWRSTGHQRAGFLIGAYEHHPDVPLGIRARVAAIYEPPQTSSRDHITLAPDPRAPLVDALCRRLGLRRVGWLFTDLLPRPNAPGEVLCTRGVETHFLSAQECVMAAHFQNQFPHACRHAPTGHYGSKFATVCVTGDSSHQIHLEGYQVSVQAAALQRADLLLPTKDAPELGCVREPTPERVVPDVYYTEKDAYGNEVKQAARRVPVAYLLLDVPCGLRAGAAPPTLSATARFPPAHRHEQSLAALHHHLARAQSFLEGMSDLHTLLFIASNDTLPLGLDAMEPLLKAVREKDALAAERWRADTPAWATLEHLATVAAAPDSAPVVEGGAEAGVWTCQLCTFHNSSRRDACEMCAMPRGNAM